MTRRDAWAAAFSLVVHAAALLALLALVALQGAAPPAPASTARAASHPAAATRVRLFGHAHSVAPAAAENKPVVVRGRGPVRRAVAAPETDAMQGEALLGTPSDGDLANAAGESGSDGDGLLGVMRQSSDALGGDERAASGAVGGAREAVRAVPTVRAPDLTRLHAALAAAAERCYPAAAKRFSQTGVAVVDFCLDAHGALLRSSVRASSGSGLLDAAATTCVLPNALPAGPEVGAGCFQLPVRFGVERR